MKKTVALLPLSIGIFAFITVVGLSVLDPTNIAWLSEDDLAAHFMGWQFYRNGPFTNPIGLNPLYGLEISNSIVYSDSIPLLAILLKPFTNFLPGTFQYFGLWIFACCSLQAWFGWKLVSLITENNTLKFFGAAFFAFSPTMIQRLSLAPGLGSHFLILASLYVVLDRKLNGKGIYWGLLLALAALVHAYLLVMVAALWIADWFARFWKIKDRPLGLYIELLLSGVLTVLVCWQAGYFTVGTSVLAPGYGLYGANLLSLVDPDSWSYLLPDIPIAEGQMSAMACNYLGLGLLFLLVLSLPALVIERSNITSRIIRYPFFLAVLAGLVVFAVSHVVGIGPYKVTIPIPEIVLKLANAFRASQRMFWPVFYSICFVILFVIIRTYKKWAVYLMGFALVLQIADTSSGWIKVGEKLTSKKGSEWETSLVDPFWKAAAEKYQKVRWIMPENNFPGWSELAYFAGRNGMGTDAVYLARLDREALRQRKSTANLALKSGQYDADTLYVLDEQYLREASENLNQEKDLLARIDGFVVLAPGWNTCAECLPRPDNVLTLDLVLSQPPITRIQ